MGKVLFEGITYDCEHDRNRYVYENITGIKPIPEKGVKKKLEDVSEGISGCGGFLIGFAISTGVALVILLISANTEYSPGFFLAITAFFLIPLFFNARAIKKHRQDRVKSARETGIILPSEESVATSNNLAKYYRQYEDFLKSIGSSSFVNDILDKFVTRYPNWDEQQEHYWELANLINVKTNIYVSGNDIKILLRSRKKNTKKRWVDQKLELIMVELSEFKERTVQDVAEAFLQIIPDEYPEELIAEEDQYALDESLLAKSIYPVYSTWLAKEGMNFDVLTIEKEVDRQRSLKFAQEFELKLSTTYSRELETTLENADAYEFERIVSFVFQKAGYRTKVTKKSGDQGADIIIEKDGVSTAVQAKKYSGSVGNKAIQEVVASKKFYDCDRAMVVTTGQFTKSAIELAGRNGVELIDRKKLFDLIKLTS